jgi:EAL domain-containing protein (putative c-di-GMP-specific phosphodiesterase class I)/CheY-like chemotaxis protein
MPRILIIDDDERLGHAWARVLKHHGYTVVVASAGASVRNVLVTERFDAIVTDLCMPEIDGTEVLRITRTVDTDVPVLLVTGSPTIRTAARAVELGAERYLIKPVPVDVLVRALAESISARQRARAREGSWQARPVDPHPHAMQLDDALRHVWMALQPIVDTHSGRPIAWEALLRSRHSTLQRPDDLLAAATACGRLYDLGRTVRSRVAALTKDLPAGAALFCNLHPVDLMDPELYERSSPLSAVAPCVVLEITERAPLDTIPDLDARLSMLRGFGYRIAIDDMGSGYSGLTALAKLKPEVVKLDMSLVRGLDGNAWQRAVVRSIASLCVEHGITIIAEGIETPNEKRAVAAAGVWTMQGYHFARPGPCFPQPLTELVANVA